ncbi:flagellar motor protein MotB [Gluconacetobacter takamatsuzukensis]|uniref:OmpA family protein n=1 Tax=Gluconacetobacter takamatsuzukensis TaxID=1286190 RepID=A0A7W4PN12_9PROT|nr:flagellar motor protein MotB [Gluconacetobacter takamatsuzukensis]MBB2203573.1 OmpA family protein [Gluconacetobacter takamatsuzukensis]
MARRNTSLVIKRGDDSETSSHHGGAWKIAYADFMTAMMSFFLVMWLLNATTDEQRRGIAQFFNPMADNQTHIPPTDGMLDTSPSPLTAGSAVKRIKDGSTSETPWPQKPGAERTEVTSTAGGSPDDITFGIRSEFTPRMPSVLPIGGPNSGAAQGSGFVGANGAIAEQAHLAQMTSDIHQAIQQNSTLQNASKNVSIQFGRDDVRIELRDASNMPMFDSGSSEPNALGRQMLAEIAKFLSPMPERISIVGYTDASPYQAGKTWTMSNWTLSALRADHAREVLVKSGYPDINILDVSGYGDRNLVVPSDPTAAANRRVVIVMHKIYRNAPAPILPVADGGANAQPASGGEHTDRTTDTTARP